VKRLDHGPMYMCVMFALLMVSMSMIAVGPVPNSVVDELSNSTQDLLALCIFVGSAICVTGITLGTRFLRRGIDIRRCYILQICGMPAVTVSLWVYGWAIIHGTESWTSALGGVMGPMIGLGALINAVTFVREIRRINRNIKLLGRLESP
jgi:vacuolar-type H+-ATPase subunit I/STV1